MTRQVISRETYAAIQSAIHRAQIHYQIFTECSGEIKRRLGPDDGYQDCFFDTVVCGRTLGDFIRDCKLTIADIEKRA